MFREYEFRDPVLIVYITDKHWYSEPNCIIRFNTVSKDFQVSLKYPHWSRHHLLQEIVNVFELLERPYWKSYVKLLSKNNHSDSYGELF